MQYYPTRIVILNYGIPIVSNLFMELDPGGRTQSRKRNRKITNHFYLSLNDYMSSHLNNLRTATRDGKTPVAIVYTELP